MISISLYVFGAQWYMSRLMILMVSIWRGSKEAFLVLLWLHQIPLDSSSGSTVWTHILWRKLEKEKDEGRLKKHILNWKLRNIPSLFFCFFTSSSSVYLYAWDCLNGLNLFFFICLIFRCTLVKFLVYYIFLVFDQIIWLFPICLCTRIKMLKLPF